MYFRDFRKNPILVVAAEQRMGLYGDRFTMLKFRTMLPDEVGTNARPATARWKSRELRLLGGSSGVSGWMSC